MKQLRQNTSEDCPTSDYEPGLPNGCCWGDGHYDCDTCIHFREDFSKDKEFREDMMSPSILTLSQFYDDEF